MLLAARALQIVLRTAEALGASPRGPNASQGQANTMGVGYGAAGGIVCGNSGKDVRDCPCGVHSFDVLAQLCSSAVSELLLSAMPPDLQEVEGERWENLPTVAALALKGPSAADASGLTPEKAAEFAVVQAEAMDTATVYLQKACRHIDPLAAGLEGSANTSTLQAALASKDVRRLQVVLLERLILHGEGDSGGPGGGAAVASSSSSSSGGGGGSSQCWLLRYEAQQRAVVMPQPEQEPEPEPGAELQSRWSHPLRQRELERTHATWLVISLGAWGRMARRTGFQPPPLALVVRLAKRAMQALSRLLSAGGVGPAGGGGPRVLGLGGASYGPRPLISAVSTEVRLPSFELGSML